MQPALLGNRSRAVPLRDTMGAARPLPEHCPGLVPSVYVVLPTRTLCAPLFVFHGCFHSVLPALLVRNINQRRVFLRAQKQTLTKDGLGSTWPSLDFPDTKLMFLSRFQPLISGRTHVV